MRKLILTLVILLCAVSMFAADAPKGFKLTDPRGDDYGNGELIYPNDTSMQKGDLDLVEFAARPVDGGTMFTVKFARPIRKPGPEPIDEVGTALNKVAREGFYTTNVDIYIDTDRVEGSGSTTTLPGREISIDPKSAWEKIICLTPDPPQARVLLQRIMLREANAREDEPATEPTKEEMQLRRKELKDELRVNVDEFVFFPERINASGSKIDFFVPASFLGGAASDKWSYVVVVSGADMIERFDQGQKFVGPDLANSLMILPVRNGRPRYMFGTDRERKLEFMPPVVDLLLPAGVDQKEILSHFGPDTMPIVPGIVPADVKR